MDFCSEYSVIWQLAGYVLYIIKVLIPIIIIILGIMDLVKALTASKDDAVDTAVKSLLIRIAIGFAIFFVPLIISTIFALIKEASPYMAKADACQVCLLRPLSNQCNGYVSAAKAEREKQKEEASKPSDDSYQVKITGCYLCNGSYVWTSDGAGCTSKIEGVKNQNDCEKRNDSTSFVNNNNPDEDDEESSSNSSASESRAIVYLGDSIMNGICQVNSEIKTCYTCVGGGLNWLTGSTDRCTNAAVSNVTGKVKENISNGGTIVIYSGTNDLSRGAEAAKETANKYVILYKNLLANQWQNVNKVIITSLNPVDENNSQFKKNYTITPSEINAFNEKLAQEISELNNSKIKYCDLGLKKENFITNGISQYVDGLHFTGTGYQKIYKAIKKCL